MNNQQDNFTADLIMPMIRRIYPTLIDPELVIWEDNIPYEWHKNKKFIEFIKDKITVRKDGKQYNLYHNHIYSKTISYSEYMILKGLDPNVINLDEINIEDFD